MEQLIDKFAVIAEIKKLDEFWHLSKSAGGQAFIESLLSFLDSLKTKEGDVEKEVEDWVKTGPHTSYPWCTIPDAIRITAEHFYELGLKAQKGEK